MKNKNNGKPFIPSKNPIGESATDINVATKSPQEKRCEHKWKQELKKVGVTCIKCGFYDSPIPHQPPQEEKCNCKETTCPKDCTLKHTHKGFFCEKCEPEAVKKMQAIYDQPPQEKDIPKKHDNLDISDTIQLTNSDKQKDWEEKFDNEFVDTTLNVNGGVAYTMLKEKDLVDELKSFIKERIEEARQEERERIKGIVEKEMGVGHSVETGATLSTIIKEIDK